MPSFNTQPPEGGCGFSDRYWLSVSVSTHSHPKVAAKAELFKRAITVRSFNTQPPEGGCFNNFKHTTKPKSFNTQPPEGGCFLQ